MIFDKQTIRQWGIYTVTTQSIKKMFNRRAKTASPKEVRASLQSYVDYWENRLETGDLLLDQWMWDAYKAAKEAVAAVDRIGAAAGIDLT